MSDFKVLIILKQHIFWEILTSTVPWTNRGLSRAVHSTQLISIHRNSQCCRAFWIPDHSQIDRLQNGRKRFVLKAGVTPSTSSHAVPDKLICVVAGQANEGGKVLDRISQLDEAEVVEHVGRLFPVAGMTNDVGHGQVVVAVADHHCTLVVGRAVAGRQDEVGGEEGAGAAELSLFVQSDLYRKMKEHTMLTVIKFILNWRSL